MPATAMARLCPREARDKRGRLLDDGDKRRGDAVEDHQDGGDDNGDTVRACNGQVLGHNLADYNVAISHHQEGKYKTPGVNEGRNRCSDYGMKKGQQQIVESVFTRPSEAETG